ncbi:MAG: helix-turn-helix transcriptional regulator [Ruminococcaceae bacterium]|nr:helix-turn-helix transcriptional regulator [Oscillospiraceae bacterium]
MFDMQKIKTEIEIDGFNSIYYFEFGKDFSHAPEKHNFWEMVYVDSGQINAITNGIGCTLEQGQAIFHEPLEPHAHISDNKVSNNMLVVSFSTDSEIMHYFKNKTFTLDKTSKTLLGLFLDEAKNALGNIPGDYENKNNLHFLHEVFGSSQLLQCYFTEFLIRLIRSGNSLSENVISSKKSRDIANNSISELICDYLKNNIYGNITLKDVCTQFLLGKTQLCKIFRENTDQSPMEYYMNLKMKEAKKLIREKNHSVSQISDILGYSSIHIFSRAFKKSVGMSPTSYAKSIY